MASHNRLPAAKRFFAVASAIVSISTLSQSSARAEVVFANQSPLGDELSLPVHSWIDDEQPVAGVVVALQGLIFSGITFDTMARYFADKGYIVYANDMRGFGDWRDPSHKFDGDSLIHFGQSKDDLTSLLKALRKKYPGKPIYCMGESFGANMAIWEAATDPGLMDGIIAASAGCRTCIHPRPLWFKTFFQGLRNPNNLIDIKPYVAPILSEDPELTKELLKRAETTNEMSVTNLIKAAVTHNRSTRLVDRIPEDMPILLLNGKLDQVQKTSALKGLIARMGSKQVTNIVFEEKGHMLLECPTLDGDVTSVIDDWLDERQEAIASKTDDKPKTIESDGESENDGKIARASTPAVPSNSVATPFARFKKRLGITRL